METVERILMWILTVFIAAFFAGLALGAIAGAAYTITTSAWPIAIVLLFVAVGLAATSWCAIDAQRISDDIDRRYANRYKANR